MEKKMDIQEVEKVIKRLSMLNGFKEYCEENPFAPTVAELTQLQNDITEMLNSYMDFLREWDAGNLVLGMDATNRVANPASHWRGKNAPAYKASIDEGLICHLWCKGISINEIARRAHCSPDTVKRRILDMQHRIKDRRKI